MGVLNKKNIVLIVTLFLMLFSVNFVFSQNEKHSIDIENTKCHDNSIPTTNAAIKCESEALKAWETEMGTYLTLLKEKNTIIDTMSLQEVQKKWWSFYNADLALYESYLLKLYKGGTQSRVAILTHKKEAIRKRMLSLKAFYEDLE